MSQPETDRPTTFPVGTDPLLVVLSELRKLSTVAIKETFWEKYSPVILPIIISVLIGVGAFYTNYRILEYKVVAVMEKHEYQVTRFEILLQKVAENNLGDKERAIILLNNKEDAAVVETAVAHVTECVQGVKEKQARHAAEYEAQKDMVNVRFRTINNRLDKLERRR